jgi:cerevisin
MATITPAKLKSKMISVATKGALSDIPADTPNLLAWNGGGSSNVTAIFAAGGYDAKSQETTTFDDLEKMVEADLKAVSGSVSLKLGSLSSKAEKFSKKIHEVVDEELKEFFEELRM